MIERSMGLDLSSPIPVTRYLTRPKAGIVLYSFLGIHPKGFLRQAHMMSVPARGFMSQQLKLSAN